uniref:Uncharacterized protein n=1 Tax=Caenorhabditis japonica TaxID=281687 RepID=A0A8R1DQW0_CAEJA
MKIITEPVKDGDILMPRRKSYIYLSIPTGLCIVFYFLMGLLYYLRRKQTSLIREILAVKAQLSAQAKASGSYETATQGTTPTGSEEPNRKSIIKSITQLVKSGEQADSKSKQSKKKKGKSKAKKSKSSETDQSPLPTPSDAPAESPSKSAEPVLSAEKVLF